tara:strand:+ start:535 stop:735 length:201 start_codon:yes stop_codon:yes gene_type:complete
MKNLTSSILVRDEKMHLCLEAKDKKKHYPENVLLLDTQSIVEQMISNSYISIEQFGTVLKFLVSII